jgi:tetratricopeptide (TPR) repeat protein
MESFEEQLRAQPVKVAFYLLLAAMGVSVLYISQYARSPFFWVPQLDSLYHDLTARDIVAGNVKPEPFFRAPLYYYFLAGIYAVFGHSFWAARLVQSAVGAVSIVLLYCLGIRAGIRPAVSLLAAGMMVLCGPIVFATNELHTPVLEIFLDLLYLNLLLATAETDCPPRRAILLAFLSGLTLGLSAIARPNILVTAPLALGWLWMQAGPMPGRARRVAPLAVLFLLGAAIAPGAVTWRNARVSGDPVFIASQGGINFFIGNRPEADGFTPSTPTRYRFDSPYEDSVALYGRRAAEEAAGRKLTASESQRYWVGRVFTWWMQDPLAGLRLLAKKWVLVWTHREIRNNTAYEYVRKEWAPSLWALPFGFWFIGPASVLGMVLAFRLRQPALRFLALFALVYMATFTLFFIADRYRLPVVPILLLLSANALAWLVETVWTLRRTTPAPAVRRSLLIAAVLFVAMAVVVNVNWYPTATPATWALDYWGAGNRFSSQKRYDEAEVQYRKALVLDSRNAEIWTNLGMAQYYQGRFDDAATSFTESITRTAGNGGAYYNLALCRLQQGRKGEARQLLSKAAAVDPENQAARRELAALTP